MKRGNREAGVTLMELLIAVSLVSLLSVGMLMAIRVGLNAMEKTNKRFMVNRRVTSVQRIIESQIGGLIPVVSECKGGGGGGKFVFFQGGPQAMKFVSSYSLQEAARGYPRILAFQVIAGEGGGVRLVVNENVYPGPVNAGLFCRGIANGAPLLADAGPNPDSFVLADKLAFCRIVYRKTLPPPELEVWLPVWTNPEQLPSGIRIEMAPLEPEPARLQVMPITVPVRITKMVLGPYADEY